MPVLERDFSLKGKR